MRRKYGHVWPIDPSSARTPPNWPGWPGGKQFGLVFTHDVESGRGLIKIPSLIALEQRYGFRSAFNLVPEGDYSVPAEVREYIQSAGCELGVHGLQHDGALYSSKRHFAEKAVRINKYLEQWGVCGFRSPLMQHRLPWLHKLNVEYDCSTFDTDPFEPEPDGFRTIFPFWVPGQDGGFVELPYTLPQDFTLFVVLREPNIEIWKRKLDWVAAHGGMILVNTHPDYMCFEGRPARDEYPASHYEELLSYIQEKYQGAFWSALPRDVARYYTSTIPLASRNTRKRICMVAYATYENDNRVRRYAETLSRRGDLVEVIALRGAKDGADAKELGGVTAFPIQSREKNERVKWTYAARIVRFLLASSAFLTRRHNQCRYDLIHVHNIPDFLVFGAWFPKWTGARLVLDIHDIVPELFENKFGARPGGFYCKLLKRIEKASTAFADHVIVSNHLWHEKLVARSVPPEKCSVFLNHIDPAIFQRRPRTRNDGKLILIFPGSFQAHQGLDIAIKALPLIRRDFPNAELHFYGSGAAEQDLRRLSATLGLNGSVQFNPSVSLDRIPELIANADIGVVPKRADSFGNEAYSTKVMEFMSQGIPVVASRTKIDTYYFDDRLVRFFPSGDPEALAAAVLDVIRRKDLRDSQVAAAFEYVNRNSWDSYKTEYLRLVDSLTVEQL